MSKNTDGDVIGRPTNHPPIQQNRLARFFIWFKAFNEQTVTVSGGLWYAIVPAWLVIIHQLVHH